VEIGHGETGKIMAFGRDQDGKSYRLEVYAVAREVFENTLRIVVQLPFKADHKIWEELRNANNE